MKPFLAATLQLSATHQLFKTPYTKVVSVVFFVSGPEGPELEG